MSSGEWTRLLPSVCDANSKCGTSLPSSPPPPPPPPSPPSSQSSKLTKLWDSPSAWEVYGFTPHWKETDCNRPPAKKISMAPTSQSNVQGSSNITVRKKRRKNNKIHVYFQISQNSLRTREQRRSGSKEGRRIRSTETACACFGLYLTSSLTTKSIMQMLRRG